MTTIDSTGPGVPFHVRQGDVLALGVEAIPEDAKPVTRDRGRVILAYGEVTGHAHAIAARLSLGTAVSLDELSLASPRDTGGNPP